MPIQSFLDASFCIYGAGIVATSIYTAIKTLYYKKPLFFLVSDTAQGQADVNPAEIDGIAVKRVSEWNRERFRIHYLVAAPVVHQDAIAASLYSMGVDDEEILMLTNEIEDRIMEAYYSSLGNCRTISGIISEDRNDKEKLVGYGIGDQRMTANRRTDYEGRIQVFQAKCHVDQPLRNSVKLPGYIVPIQVGAVFTNEKIASIQDHQGENISGKNRNYCELTATYYAWKHSKADYKGLCHYRRIFDLSEKQMQTLLEQEQEWDVILPYPSVHYPDISAQHMRYINEKDWQALLQALRETAPEYLEAYERLLMSGEQYFFNYNMLVARAEIFDDYCSFLFRVLGRAEEVVMPRGWERADRFAGYMGENLTTLYFLANRDRLKTAYAGVRWLV